MTTPEELEAQKAHLQGQQIAYRWMKRHILDFDQSQESAKKIGDYLKAYGLSLSEDNLQKAFVDLRAQGVSFISPATAAATAPTTAVEEPLPEIPHYFPKMETKADIGKILREKYRELYFGKHRELFKARINAVMKRGV